MCGAHGSNGQCWYIQTGRICGWVVHLWETMAWVNAWRRDKEGRREREEQEELNDMSEVRPSMVSRGGGQWSVRA